MVINMPYGDCTGPDGRGPRRRLLGRVGDLFRGRDNGYGYNVYNEVPPAYGYAQGYGFGRRRGRGGNGRKWQGYGQGSCRGRGRGQGRRGGRW